jgi:PEP-CTERM motif
MCTFLDDPNAAVINGVSITQITGITDSGEIAGFYGDTSGRQRVSFATQTPEPSGLLLAGLGAALVTLSRKRKRS